MPRKYEARILTEFRGDGLSRRGPGSRLQVDLLRGHPEGAGWEGRWPQWSGNGLGSLCTRLGEILLRVTPRDGGRSHGGSEDPSDRNGLALQEASLLQLRQSPEKAGLKTTGEKTSDTRSLTKVKPVCPRLSVLARTASSPHMVTPEDAAQGTENVMPWRDLRKYGTVAKRVK